MSHARLAALAVATFVLGLSLQVNWGTWHPQAAALLAVAVLIATLGISDLGPTRWRLDENSLGALLLGLTVAQLAELVRGAHAQMPAGMVMDLTGPKALWPLDLGAAAAAVLCLAGFSSHRLAGWPRFALLCGVHLALGRWMIWASPDPHMDVYAFEQLATAELLAGHNPYAMTFPDVLHDASLYGPGLVKNGRLMFGFVYPPVVLLWLAAGRLLGHDGRSALLLAMTLSGVFIAAARPSRVSFAAATLFMFTPRFLFTIEQAWTDSLMVMLLAACTWAALRWPRGLPYLLGAFLVSKQYLLFAAPAVVMLRPTPKLLLKAGLTGAALTLPFMLWNPAAFFESVVWLQFQQPFRLDALSFSSTVVHLGLGDAPSAAWGFLAGAVGAALCLWKLPRTPASFAAAVGFTLLCFFAFNKQAFCNYYVFVIGAFAASMTQSSADNS